MRLIIVSFILFVFVKSQIINGRESRLVLINSGPVRGYKIPRLDVFEFHGIPYAKAPTGAHRFKAPLPPPAWFGTFEAVDKGIVCPQLHVIEDLSEYPLMKEDCLIANIFVPNSRENNLPVVVYVHGGAFLTGYGNLVNPSKFISGKNIIAVTFNYRLGAHGFLCLGTKDVPGNAGMKDQVALLRWVKKNIASFGGNPDDITISGYSAGSTAVDLLLISKMADGLFNKVIAESGASISPLSVQVDPILTAKAYADLIGYSNVDDIYQLEHFFKDVSYEILQTGSVLYQKDLSLMFSPCVERDLGQEIFLDDNPINILRKGNFSKVPILYGFANMEGLMRISVFDFWSKDMNEKFEEFLPADLQFKSKDEKVLVANTIKQFYFGDSPIDNKSVLEFIDYFSHTIFVCPTLRVINHLLTAGHNQIYLYVYSYTDENSAIIPHTHVLGAPHCAQTNIVLAPNNENIYSKSTVTQDFKNMQSIMRELWMSFIINGKPEASGVPTWLPVGKNGSPHLVLKKIPKLGESLLEESCSFWNKIYDSYYSFPMSPLSTKNRCVGRPRDLSDLIGGNPNAPLPPPAWFGTFEAVDKGIVCPQLHVIEDLSEYPLMKEDCLIANIFVPNSRENNLPVVVYVHGGAFLTGYGNLVNPSKFISGKNIIAVTFNYRLGAHGFLCLGTKDVPGNAGMKDQVALLRWVKKNIASFGGNPDDITISGYSAGSTAVDLLLISKMADGLFNKVIAESGASISPLSVQVDPILTAKAYADLIGYSNVDDIYQLEHFFKDVSYEILQTGSVLYQKDLSLMFSPCVERDLGQEIFLDDNPINILRKGNFSKVPILYGFANMEGLMRISVFDFWSKDMNEKFEEFLPADLQFKSKDEKVLVANTIKQFYFGDSPIDNKSVLEFIDYFSHTIFVCPTLRVINHLLTAGHNQIYLYVYSYTDENSAIIPHTHVLGAPHCAQTNIVLAPNNENIYSKSTVTQDFKNMQSIMRELWMSFIINGKPEASGVPTWLPVGKNGSPHLVLKKIPKLGESLLEESCSFWNKIYDSYYSFPMSPLSTKK